MPPRTRLVIGAVRYLAGKALTIAVTVFIGVFFTVLLANQPSRRGLGPPESPFETSLEAQISLVVRANINHGTIRRDANGDPDPSQVEALTEKLRKEAGLNLPHLPRYMLWTVKALTFDWGQLGARQGGSFIYGQKSATASANDIILQYLPNTMLLVGTAYLLVFLIGMPLSLYLARNYGHWLDRAFAALSPISSVPSWVFGIVLIAIFALQLRWLPFGGMFDFHRPEDPIEYARVLARHMILPVSAIVLSLLFQVVYTWRTFFMIYAEEDYVELARAKGLPSKVLERQYILRPALPYIITSFATTLIGFWQLSMALEAIFQWPGLGWLYIKEALPNFWGESMEPGELIIVVGIVVIFAYLLGCVVFILDLAYVMIDPRIHLLPANNAMPTRAWVKSGGVSWKARLKAWMKWRGKDDGKPTRGRAKGRGFSWIRAAGDFKESILDFHGRSGVFFQELRRYPSAIFGLTVILVLLVGSIYAVIALPYDQYGKDYDQKRMTDYSYAPRTAMPAWMNLFSDPPRLSTLIMAESSKEATVSLRALDGGWVEKTIAFTFQYPYKEIPSEIFLYLGPKYNEKIPFASLEWTYPDGRTLELKRIAAGSGTSYDFESGIRTAQLLDQHPEWKNWFVQTGLYPTPAFTLLFAEPGSSQSVPQHGTYRLTITALLFEKGSDLQPQLVLLGQVYGLAGTDYGRRDLMVPLFWGMPFALLIGLLGTLLTTLVAMLLPAIGVWFGGWVDNLIQRLTEVNMVLPSLTIAVLTNVLFGLDIWIILGIVVVVNAFGSPIKILRAALLQAKEAPYIETARSYGASDLRIIMRYLVPRILPVLIPQLVTQVPSFIFWEATLGLFNIKSTYPSWGRIIYEGLAQGALYGSPFWVLEPISLLLLTSFAFAMLGSALERILNPRMLEQVPARADKPRRKADETNLRPLIRWVIAVSVVLLLIAAILIPSKGKEFTNVVMDYVVPAEASDSAPTVAMPVVAPSALPLPPVSSATDMPDSGLRDSPAPTPTPLTAPLNPATLTLIVPQSVLTLLPVNSRPVTYVLRAGEFPYCIARRFNVNPIELLTLNGLTGKRIFYAGTVLKIPQTGNPFPGERMLRVHPTTYRVSTADGTVCSVACEFGDIDPQVIADANHVSVEAVLLIGRELTIP